MNKKFLKFFLKYSIFIYSLFKIQSKKKITKKYGKEISFLKYETGKNILLFSFFYRNVSELFFPSNSLLNTICNMLIHFHCLNNVSDEKRKI